MAVSVLLARLRLPLYRGVGIGLALEEGGIPPGARARRGLRAINIDKALIIIASQK